MVSFKRLSLILMTSCAGAALTACDGATSVASPGDGVIVVPAPSPSPSPSPSPTPTPTPGTPADSCPTGTTDVGTIAGAYRSCRLPDQVTGTLSLPKVAGVAYEISGRVDVGRDVGSDGSGGQSATLEIAAGTLFYANANDSADDYIMVNRGSKVMAEGTADDPIVMTAQQNLTGQVTDSSQGLWGGLILAGRAPISQCNTTVAGGSEDCENIVEGTGNVLYGGAKVDDDSGVVRYLQIRYSGRRLATDVELQGLTLAGVGYGTTIDHVQIHNSSDDGIEVFGGTANVKNIVFTGADDDGFDTDQGWTGYAQFLLNIQGNTSEADSFSTEIDSNGSEDALPRQHYHVANFTFVHNAANTPAAMRIRGGADARFVNGIVTTPVACMTVVAGPDNATIRDANSSLQDDGPPMFNSVYFGCDSATKFAESTVSGNTISASTQANVFAANSTNSTIDGTRAAALENGFYPTSTTLGVTPFDPKTLNPSGRPAFLVSTDYIGAVSGPGDDWFVGWTCNSNRANFGSQSGSCAGLPN